MASFTVGRAGIALSVALPAILGACASPSGPSEIPLPAGAVEIASPAVYREWHQRTERCSGLADDFSTMKFYVVPGVETFSTGDGHKVGQWIQEGSINKIIIAGNYRDHEMVVSHEMLHALIGKVGHPTEYFNQRCHLTWDTWEQGA